MDDFISIFAKLIIAFISVVIPIIISLLSIQDAVIVIRRRFEEEERQIQNLLKIHILNAGTAEINALIKKSNADLIKNEKNAKKEINLLNPKIQILRMFPMLFFSLIFLMIDVLVRADLYNLYYHWLSVLFIFLSVFLFNISLLLLWRVVSAMIDAKKIIEEEKRTVTLGHVI